MAGDWQPVPGRLAFFLASQPPSHPQSTEQSTAGLPAGLPVSFSCAWYIRPFFFISMENLRNRMLPREPAAGRGRHWHLIQEQISFCQWLRAHDPLVTSRGPATASTKGKGEGAEEGDGMGAGREAAKRDQGIGSLLWARAAAHSAAFGRGLRRLLLSARTLKHFSSSRRVRLVPRCEAR